MTDQTNPPSEPNVIAEAAAQMVEMQNVQNALLQAQQQTRVMAKAIEVLKNQRDLATNQSADLTVNLQMVNEENVKLHEALQGREKQVESLSRSVQEQAGIANQLRIDLENARNDLNMHIQKIAVMHAAGAAADHLMAGGTAAEADAKAADILAGVSEDETVQQGLREAARIAAGNPA